jgi:hypothetical protein
MRVERLIDAARRHEDHQSLRDDVVVLAVERPVRVDWAPVTLHPPRTAEGDGAGAPAEGSPGSDGAGVSRAAAPPPAERRG